jgi:hypothetical protein
MAYFFMFFFGCQLPINLPQYLPIKTAIAEPKPKIHGQVSDGTISSSIKHHPIQLVCTKPMPQLHQSFS